MQTKNNIYKFCMRNIKIFVEDSTQQRQRWRLHAYEWKNPERNGCQTIIGRSINQSINLELHVVDQRMVDLKFFHRGWGRVGEKIYGVLFFSNRVYFYELGSVIQSISWCHLVKTTIHLHIHETSLLYVLIVLKSD